MKERFKDTDLREALRRREERRLKPQPSADFCDSVVRQIEVRPASRRRWHWVAAAACLLIIIGIGAMMWPKEETAIVAKVGPTPEAAQSDTLRADEHSDVQKAADTVNIVKEILQMSKPPRHYMAKRRTSPHNAPLLASHSATSEQDQTDGQGAAAPTSEPDLMDEYVLAEKAFEEEERRFIMKVMAQMNGSILTDYQEMTKEIRQRGERMTRQVEIAISDDTY